MNMKLGTIFFAGKVTDAVLAPLQKILEAAIKAVILPVLEAVIKALSGLFQMILENIIAPLVEFIANNMAFIIEKLLVPIAQIAMLLWKPVMSIGMMLVFKIVTMLIGQFLGGILNLAILPADFLEKNKFLVSICDGMQILAIALVGLFSAYYGIKSMFLYLGFESEEPWKIMVRVGAAAILVYASIDICSYFFKFYYVLQDTIFQAFNVGDGVKFDKDIFGDTLSENMFNTLDPASQFFDLVVFLTITVKLLMLAVKFVERQVLLMVFVIFSPLAFACSVAKPIRDYFSLWVKGFVGNFLVQGVQITGICLIFAITSSGEYKTSLVLGSNVMQNLMILGCISIIQHAATVVQSVTGMASAFDLGATGFNMAKGMTQSIATNAIPQAKAIGSTMKAVNSLFRK